MKTEILLLLKRDNETPSHLFIHPSIHQPIRPSTHPSIYSFIHSFIPRLIHKVSCLPQEFRILSLAGLGCLFHSRIW